MELGLHFTELTCCEQTGRLVMSHEETMETAIAEYCPDMTRIVSVCGQLQIRERTALPPILAGYSLLSSCFPTGAAGRRRGRTPPD